MVNSPATTMSSSTVTPTSSTDRTMPFLPLEILQNIGKNLDIESARNLARTCRNLRDAGECKIWERLDLTSGWNESKAGLLRRTTEATSARRAVIVSLKLRHASDSLASYPYRASCVKEIHIEPVSISIIAPTPYPLLERFATQINKLHILPIDSGEFNLFPVDSTPLLFPRLYYLRYQRRYGNPTLLHWISAQSHLDGLDLSGALEQDGAAPVRFGPKVLLGDLCDLSFDGLSCTYGPPPESHQHLAELLDISPCLEFLHLSGYWRPKDNDPILLAMAGTRLLHTLVLSHEGNDATQICSLPGVRYWRFGKVDITARWIVVKIDSLSHKGKWHKNVWFDLNYIRLPRSGDLERLTILTHYEPLSDPTRIDDNPLPTELVPNRFIHELRKCDHITTVAFARTPESLSSLSDPLFIQDSYDTPPDIWESDGLFGTIIRQYTNPADTGEVLWHLRGLYPRDDDTSMRTWRDHLWYKGHNVPREVLEGVYEAAGEELEFLEGGRGLPLGEGDAAWVILRSLLGTSVGESDMDYDTEFSEDDRYEPEGYDADGKDEDGYNEEGWDESGYDQEGFDQWGLDADEKDRAGYDKHGLNDEGLDREGFNWLGLDEDGFYKNGEPYDPEDDI